MLKKRLIGVIAVKSGWAVQSFGFGRYLPLGRPECLAENLDRWGVDEILVLAIDRSRQKIGPDLELLKKLGRLGLSTPLTYGGGIQDVEQAATVIQSGADRLCVDVALHGNHQEIYKMSEFLGSQALIASLPLSWDGLSLHWYNYLSEKSITLDNGLGRLFSDGHISEALLIDYLHEGGVSAFNANLVDQFPYKGVPQILFGGITSRTQVAELLGLSCVAAVAVGNSLNYSEHAVQNLKLHWEEMSLRPPTYGVLR
jgi:cyclase